MLRRYVTEGEALIIPHRLSGPLSVKLAEPSCSLTLSLLLSKFRTRTEILRLE